MIHTPTLFESRLQKHRIFYAIIYLLSFLAIGLESATLGPTLKQLSIATGSSLAAVTTFIAIKALGYTAGTIIGSKLFDRYQGHRIMVISIAWMSFGMLMIPFARNFVVAVSLITVLGFVEGVIDIGGNLLIMRVFQDNLPPYMNALHSMFGVGCLFAPLITAHFMTAGNSLQMTYWVIASFFIPSMVGFLLLPSPPVISAVKMEESGRKLHDQVVVLFAMLFFAYVGVAITFSNWIFTYASESKMMSDISAAYLNSLYWGSFTLGRLIAVFLSRKIEPKKLLICDYIGSALTLGFMMIFRGNSAALWIGTVFLGLFLATVYPTMMVFAGSLFPVTGSVASRFMTGSGMGVLTIPFLMTYLFNRIGISIVPVVLFIVGLIGLILFLLTLLLIEKKKVRNNPFPEI